MPIKILASAMIAALLMTGTVTPVSPASGQGAQLSEPTVAAATVLTEAEAIATALDHANLTESEVTNIRAYVERDDHRRHWEVHWRSGDWVYDYDIDPETGTILEWERDHEPVRQTPKTEKTEKKEKTSKTPAPAEPAPTAPAPEPSELTREEAQAIALKHAGFTADQVSGLRTSRDNDDRTPTYDVEFRVGRFEYEYEIHAETGRILDFDKDD